MACEYSHESKDACALQTIRHPKLVRPCPMHGDPAAATGKGAPECARHRHGRDLDTREVTATVHKPHALWLTEAFVELNVSELLADWTPI